jgi:hypothetical protein
MCRAGHTTVFQEEEHRTDYRDLEDERSRIGEVVKQIRPTPAAFRMMISKPEELEHAIQGGEKTAPM